MYRFFLNVIWQEGPQFFHYKPGFCTSNCNVLKTKYFGSNNKGFINVFSSCQKNNSIWARRSDWWLNVPLVMFVDCFCFCLLLHNQAVIKMIVISMMLAKVAINHGWDTIIVILPPRSSVFNTTRTKQKINIDIKKESQTWQCGNVICYRSSFQFWTATVG